MSAITIILASLSALALAILILAAIDDRKRQQRLGPMKLGAMSRESFVNRGGVWNESLGEEPIAPTMLLLVVRQQSRAQRDGQRRRTLVASAPGDPCAGDSC